MEHGATGLHAAFERQQAKTQYYRERVQSQLAFARYLCARHPDHADEWHTLIGKAEAVVGESAAKGTTAPADAVAEAEQLLAPLADTAHSYTIYCVGHAHIDMNWMWSWPETVSTTVDTFTTVLRLMDEHPDFVFTQSQASVYRIIEEHAPELLERIKMRVADGRWEVAASQWVECDKNMVDGESLCRHLLYTRQYMHELFGLTADDITIDWAPDTFGHAYSVPTCLTRGGVRWVHMHRPGLHTIPPPGPEAFWWQGPDGARVLVRNDQRRGYNGSIGPHVVSECLTAFVNDTNLPFAMYVYGVGDHGGGPTRRDLARLADMRQWPIYPAIQTSRAAAFFTRLEREGASLPVVDGELNHVFTGCYTSQSLVKKANRYATRSLVESETAAALGQLLAGVSYPSAMLTEAWRDTLFSHFHDILPGSGVRDTRTFAHGMYQRTAARTAQAQTRALRALAARVDT